LILGFLAAAACADHRNTDIRWAGWRVESSEDLYEGKKYTQYPLTYLFDGRPETAWVFSGLPHKPTGEDPAVKPEPRRVVLQIWADQPFHMDRMKIMNGYNKSPEVFARNNRITGLRVTLHGSDQDEADPSPHARDATLADRIGWHTVTMERRKVYGIELEVTAFVKGADDDICISGLELWDGDRKVDLQMPAVVLASDGDECGCGYTSRLVDWNGNSVLGKEQGGGVVDGSLAGGWSPSGTRFAFEVTGVKTPTVCVYDVAVKQVVLTRMIYWHTTESLTWIKSDELEITFPKYTVNGKPGGPQRIEVPASVPPSPPGP
jgi:hypothetical protein